MGMIQRVVRAVVPAWFESKMSAALPLIAKVMRPGEPVWSPRTYESYSKEGYSQNAIVFRCIDLISKGAASVPWGMYDGDTELERHPFLDLLKKPNPFQGGHDFIRNFIAYLLIQGDSYIEGVTAGGIADLGKDTPPMTEPPKELYALRPDRMAIIPGASGQPAKFRYKMGEYKKDWLVDQLTGDSAIIHWKTFNPLNDWYGLSAIGAAAMSVDQHNGAGRWNKALLDNSGQPSGVFEYAPEGEAGAVLPAPSRRQLEQDIDERMAGSVNAGRPWIIDGGLKWTQMGLNARDMDWLAGKKMSAQEICGVFGVGTQLLGIEGSQTFANYGEARQALYEDVILPMLDNVKDLFNAHIVPLYGNPRLELRPELDNLPALQLKREKQWNAVQAATWLTPNEKREATGYEPYVSDPTLDPADTLYNATGLTALGAEPATDPNADANQLAANDLTKRLVKSGISKTAALEIARITYGNKK